MMLVSAKLNPVKEDEVAEPISHWMKSPVWARKAFPGFLKVFPRPGILKHT
jgi:hypothetical protein